MATSHTTLKPFRSSGLLAGAAPTMIGGVKMNRVFAKMLGFSICNTSNVAITIRAYVTDALGVTCYWQYNTPIGVGSTLVIAGPADQYAILQAGDSVYVSVAGAGGSADVQMSIEERSE